MGSIGRDRFGDIDIVSTPSFAKLKERYGNKIEHSEVRNFTAEDVRNYFAAPNVLDEDKTKIAGKLLALSSNLEIWLEPDNEIGTLLLEQAEQSAINTALGDLPALSKTMRENVLARLGTIITNKIDPGNYDTVSGALWASGNKEASGNQKLARAVAYNLNRDLGKANKIQGICSRIINDNEDIVQRALYTYILGNPNTSISLKSQIDGKNPFNLPEISGGMSKTYGSGERFSLEGIEKISIDTDKKLSLIAGYGTERITNSNNSELNQDTTSITGGLGYEQGINRWGDTIFVESKVSRSTISGSGETTEQWDNQTRAGYNFAPRAMGIFDVSGGLYAGGLFKDLGGNNTSSIISGGNILATTNFGGNSLSFTGGYANEGTDVSFNYGAGISIPLTSNSISFNFAGVTSSYDNNSTTILTPRVSYQTASGNSWWNSSRVTAWSNSDITNGSVSIGFAASTEIIKEWLSIAAGVERIIYGSNPTTTFTVGVGLFKNMVNVGVGMPTTTDGKPRVTITSGGNLLEIFR